MPLLPRSLLSYTSSLAPESENRGGGEAVERAGRAASNLSAARPMPGLVLRECLPPPVSRRGCRCGRQQSPP
eukprot:358390-Chlamydomonas_euryale.AAC.7